MIMLTPIICTRRYIVHFCVMLIALTGLLLAGCANAPHRAPQKVDEFSVHFIYRGSMGVGPTPNSSTAILSEGQESAAIRRAIRSALQTRNSGVTEEKETEVTSDIVALSRQQVEEYNAASEPQFHLTNDREYGLAYVVRFDINTALIDFRIAAQMNERGRNNPWRRLNEQRQYNSLYFTQSLAEQVNAALVQASVTDHPEP